MYTSRVSTSNHLLFWPQISTCPDMDWVKLWEDEYIEAATDDYDELQDNSGGWNPELEVVANPVIDGYDEWWDDNHIIVPTADIGL